MKTKYFLYLAWLVSIVASLGSLYFSEVMHLPPCVLCWYQRICLYPLVIIIGVGLWQKSRQIPYYVLPLSLIGLGIAIYHNLLYYNIIPEALAPCRAGVSCTTKFFEWFGFITIPWLSMLALTIISVAMIIVLVKEKNEQRD